MINWTLSNLTQDQIKGNPQIVAICDECKQTKNLTYRAYKRNIAKHGRYRCKTCYLQSNEAKQKVSEAAKQLWKDETYREKQHKTRVITQPIRSKQIWEKHRDRITASLKGATDQDKRSELSKALWTDESYRDKISKSMIEWWANHDNRTKMAGRSQPNISKIHLITCSILDDLNVKYTNEFVLGPWSFDICIEPGIKNILVEIQGDYIHSLPHKVRADKAKYTYYERYLSDRYQLKYIWEHEFYNQNRIATILGYWIGRLPPNIDFKFPDVQIRDIDSALGEQLLEKYHYLSKVTRRGACKGAFLGDVLVAVGVFSPPVRIEVATSCGYTPRDVLELSRFCIHPSYQKKNFASWLLSRFTRELCCKAIIAFSDETYNHNGTIYKASNWEYLGPVKPDYWYVKDNWIMHKKTLWNRAVNLKMTEKQFADTYKYHKVQGKQKHKYILRKTS